MKSVLLMAALMGQTVPESRLVFSGQAFTLSTGGQSHTIPISPPQRPPQDILHPSGASLRWNDGGVRVTTTAGQTIVRFADAPTSTDLFSPDEIVRHRSDLEANRRSPAPDAILAHAVLGDRVFLLLSWGGESNPWFEALCSVDISASPPVAQYHGRFAGPAATRDGMDVDDGTLYLIVRYGDGWGYATYTPVSHTFLFTRRGDDLRVTHRLPGGLDLTVERTPYGTTVVRRHHFRSGRTRVLAEVRGDVTVLQATSPTVIDVNAPTGRFLRNLDTGAERPQAAGTPVRVQGSFAVAWSPAAEPTSATAFEVARWRPLATWNRASARLP